MIEYFVMSNMPSAILFHDGNGGFTMIYDLQRANMWKRISARILDVILLSILAVAFALFISWISGYNRYNEQLRSYYAEYEEKYGITFNLTGEEYNNLSEEEIQLYQSANQALTEDEDAVRVYSTVVNLTLLITTFGILFAYLVTDFTVPLILKNGQTLGKKIFSIGVMSSDGIRLGTPQLLIRTLLGKYTVETMIPVMILLMLYFNIVGLGGTIILALLAVTQVVLFCATKTNSVLHDKMAQTVVVDMGSQMIFNSRDEAVDYINKRHAERTAHEPY